METPVRWAGLCFVGAGLLPLPAVTHPDILEIGLAASRTPLWTLTHAIGHRRGPGGDGALSGIEAFAFPAVARAEPALLDFDGPVAGAPAFWILGGLALLWLLAAALLGIAVARAGVLPRAPALLLAGGALGFAAFEGPFVPVLGQLAVVLLAGAQIWLGVVLVRSGQSVPEDSRSSGSSRSRSSAEIR
jgi:hypothetical protein